LILAEVVGKELDYVIQREGVAYIPRGQFM